MEADASGGHATARRENDRADAGTTRDPAPDERGGGGGGRIRYRTEYLGWLPYGQYHEVEVERAGEERPVPLKLPSGWEMSDLLAIEQAGHLRRVSETHEAALDVDEIIYDLVEAG